MTGRLKTAVASLVALGTVLAAACGGQPKLTPLPPPPAPSASAPVAVSSAPVGWQPTPDAPFRQEAPKPGPSPEWQAPVPSEHTLSNGMRVLYVKRPKLPVVAVQVSSYRGAAQQPLPGLGSFMGAMLEQGTKNRSALQISDDYLNIGAEHGASANWDSTGAWMKVLSQHLDAGLDILADVVQNPAFAPEEVERVRAQRLAAIQQQLDSPQALLMNSIVRTVYQRHPYGEPLIGTIESVKRITPQAIRQYYQATFTPRETVVVAVGDIQEQELIAKLEKHFGQWKRAGRAAPRLQRPASQPAKIVLLDLPGAAQSNIAVAGVGLERNTPSFDQVLMANTLFGGMFSSRLNLSLRERHAFTYGARSLFDMRQGPGPVLAYAAVDTPKTGPAIREMLNEFERFCAQPVSPQELSVALGTLVKSLPGRFATAEDTAQALADLAVYSLPPDEYRTRPDRLEKITANQVQAAARQYLNPARMQIVVVGDRKAIVEDLKALQVGPIQVIDKLGKVKETIAVPGPHKSYTCPPENRTPAQPQ